MHRILTDIKKYILIYFIFVKNCLIAQMEYRINFISGIAVECGYLLAKILYIVVIYRAGVVINGLTPDAILMFIGTYIIMTGLYMGLFAVNFYSLSGYIRDGTLDMFIIKPISLQFITTLRYIDFGMPIPNVTAGIVLVVIGWNKVGIPVTLINIIGFICFIIGGVFLNYALFLLPQLLSFWTVKTGGVNEISNALWDFNNMPMGIYNKWIQRIGTFLIPVFLITNYSPLFVLSKLSYYYIIWGILAPIIFMIICRLLWNFAVRNYTSASS